MKIKIEAKNESKIIEAIKKVDKLAKVRLGNYLDIVIIKDSIEKRLNNLGINKKDRLGAKFSICGHAQKFPNSYKYTPYATVYRIEYCKSGVFITDIYRGICPTKDVYFNNQSEYKQFFQF